VPFPGENFVAVAMKHLNEPVPDLRLSRPDVPLRLVAAVERALEKDPARRFGSMDQFAWELRQCLAELGSSDGERTLIRRSPAVRESRPHPVRTRSRRPLLVALAGLVVVIAVVAALIGLHGSSSPGKQASSSGGGGAAIALHGVATSDPAGDGEHDTDVPKATDGNPATYWYTQSYYNGDGSLGKSGVGIVLDASRTAAAKTVTVTTDTPGYTAQILAGSAPNGPFSPDSSPRTVAAQTTFTLQGKSARYFVVWITNLGSNRSVHVNEVRARG
jgi:hypothetical protein